MKRTTILILVITLLIVIMGCDSTTSKKGKEVENSTSETQVETGIRSIEEITVQNNYIRWWWKGDVLSVENVKVKGPSGMETYFNEDISKIVERMKKGFIGEYWIREDGVKMFGEYIICKANYNQTDTHPNLPIGTVIPTTLGIAIVSSNDTDDISIAVTW